MGTVLVDIGAGATTIAIFEQGRSLLLQHCQSAANILRTIFPIGLRTQTEIAEKIKLKFGCAFVGDAAADQIFKVMRIGSNVEKEFSQVDLANIIEPRCKKFSI